MPESPRDLRKAVHDANEAIRDHARGRDAWTDLDQLRHSQLVQAWHLAVAELRAAEDDEARPSAA